MFMMSSMFMRILRRFSLYLMSLFYVVAGTNHFVHSDFYMKIMPPGLPAPELLHKCAGALEILLGVLALFPSQRRRACWALIALLLAIFPANIYSAVYHINPVGEGPDWVLWARLPVQALFILWAYWHSRDERVQSR